MLKIKGIRKVFKSHFKREKGVVALDDINLSFSKNELVFIVGKSGSGKSTLLNIIGTLDKPTSGSVCFLNKEYKSFTSRDVDSFRQNIAFIFQDFALIDALNVSDNIKMARSDITDNDVVKALKDVELEGYENRKIKTLSAGQKQRVAIARAIVKSPKIILCDEPTGNLDFSTSQAILKCLKKISKNSLVLLISHNLDDAYTYGSRVIELEEGRVKTDVEIDSEHESKPYVIDNNGLYLTTVKSISKKEINDISLKISTSEIKYIEPKTSLFKPHRNVESNNKEEFNRNHKNIKFKDLFVFSHKLLKKQFPRTLLFSIVSALILAVFSISSQIMNFNETKYLEKSLDDMGTQHSYQLLAHNENRGNYLTYLTPGYEEKLEGVKGKDYFEIYNITPNIGLKSYIEESNASGLNIKSYTYSESGFAINHIKGTIKMNEDAASSLFNNGNGFELIEEYEYKPSGCYVPDVMMKGFKNQDITITDGKVMLKKGGVDYYTSYINGVFKTDIFEKYPQFAGIFDKTDLSKDDLEEYKNMEGFASFLLECEEKYSYVITFEDDYINEVIKEPFEEYVISPREYRFEALEKANAESPIEGYEARVNVASKWFIKGERKPELYTSPVEVYVSAELLNSLNGLSWTEDQYEEVFAKYGYKESCYCFPFSEAGDNYSYENMNLLGIKDGSTTSHQWVDATLLHMMVNMNPLSKIAYSIISFDNAFIAKNLNNFEDANLLFSNSGTTLAIKLTETIEIYKDLFNIIYWLTLIIAILMILFVSYDSVRRQNYSIGVLKSLGVRDREISGVFSFHGIELLIATGILTLITESIFISFADNVLKFAIERVYSGTIPNIPIISFDTNIFLISLLIIFTSSVVSLVISLLSAKSYKPINILKSKY